MTTKQMEYILELSRTRNFNRAAENLFITQPALTYQIQRAEEELGFTLFVRSGRGAALTIAGEQFIGAVEHILEEYGEAVAAGQKLDPLFSAAITLALPQRFALPGLTDVIRAFEADYPKVPITPRYYGAAQQSELPDADILFVARENRTLRRKGWRERFTLTGYRGAEGIPELTPQDIVVEQSEGNMIWVPFSAEPIVTSVLLKNEEEREEVLHFAERIRQLSQI